MHVICDQIFKSFSQIMCEWGIREHVCVTADACGQLTCVYVCVCVGHVCLIISRCSELEVLVSEFAVDPPAAQHKRRVSIPRSVHPSASGPHWLTTDQRPHPIHNRTTEVKPEPQRPWETHTDTHREVSHVTKTTTSTIIKRPRTDRKIDNWSETDHLGSSHIQMKFTGKRY